MTKHPTYFLLPVIAFFLLTGFFDSASEALFKQGETIICEVERGLLFGGNYSVKVNKQNASEDIEYGAHGQSTRVYRLDSGKTVKKSSCRIGE